MTLLKIIGCIILIFNVRISSLPTSPVASTITDNHVEQLLRATNTDTHNHPVASSITNNHLEEPSRTTTTDTHHQLPSQQPPNWHCLEGMTGSRRRAPPSSRPARRRRGVGVCHTLNRVNTVWLKQKLTLPCISRPEGENRSPARTCPPR